MPITLKEFQEDVCAGLVARFANVRALYQRIGADAPVDLSAARRRVGAMVLQAPTGAGKTVIAIETLTRVSMAERVVWFWFAPFAGLVDQSRKVLAAQAPQLRLFDLNADRHLDAVIPGGVFVTTWAAVATRRADSRKARVRSDSGLALDELIEQAREAGLRIGCVVDEAHHGFHKAIEAQRFFKDVLRPDYTLMMTATPRDRDAAAFARDTGWQVGESADWATVSRADAVRAGLLKHGVRTVRFLARDDDAAQLVDFEHLALAECAAVHRRIKAMLVERGIGLTPLMLVQVPDGKAAQEAARRYLVETLAFSENAVRVHTADEPDPDLLALANDPDVEVLVFKMAVALGFDAPRAFTLAALRGVRDTGFAVQVIGRIMRVHALLQGRELPDALNHGYVFLANAQSQEGLLEAGEQINALATQAPDTGTQTVVTVVGDQDVVQVARSGEPLRLLVTQEGATTDAGSESGGMDTISAGADAFAGDAQPLVTFAQSVLGLASGIAASPSESAPEGSRLAASMLTLESQSQYRYSRRDDAPARLRSERLPPRPEDLESRLARFVDFSGVLDTRNRTREKVRRLETDLFDPSHASESQTDIWASLSPEAVADKASQLRLRLVESADYLLHGQLLERFRLAIEQSGAVPPDDEEMLLQQLDLVMVRNPRLLADAYKRCRSDSVLDVDVALPAELHSDVRLPHAERALHGVEPVGMNPDETQIARLLDACPQVRWWHRNPSREESSVGLYRWDEGDGFFPDFIVSLEGRDTPHGIALLEVKGDFLWGKNSEVEKSFAEHREYGRVFMVGRARGEREFSFLRALSGKLERDGAFDPERLRF